MAEPLATAYVEIEPDLSGFAEMLRAKLEEATAQSADVRIGADTEGFEEGAAEVEAQKEALGADGAEVRITTSGDAREQMAQDKAAVEDLAAAKATPQIGVEDEALRSGLSEDQQRLDALTGRSPEVGLRDSALRRQLAEDAATLRAFSTDHAQPSATLSDEDLRARVTAAAGMVATLSAMVAQVRAEADDGQLKDSLAIDQAMLQALGQALANPHVALSGVEEVEAGIASMAAHLEALGVTQADPKVTLDDDELVTRTEADKARIAELQRLVAIARAGLEDGDLKAKLLTDEAALEKLSSTVASPTVTVGGLATVEARLIAISQRLAQVGAETATPAVGMEDAPFQTRLEAVRAKIADLSTRTATASADLHDASLKRKVAEDIVILESLDRKTARPDVSLGGLASAEAALVGITKRTKDAENATSGFRGALGNLVAPLDSLLSSVGGGGGKFQGLIEGFGGAESAGEGMGSMLPLVVGGIAAVIPLAGVLAGALAALPAIMSGVVAGAGALIGGLAGVFGAVQAYMQMQQQAGTAGVQFAQQQAASAQAVQSAANAIISAREAEANAVYNGAQSIHSAEEQVRQAELSLAQAQYQEREAQIALTEARQQAQFQLEDYSNQLKDAALQQQQDILAVQQAKLALDQTLSSPAATALQRQQAQLAYEQAVQQLQDQQTQYDQLKTTAAQAAAKGVDGADSVRQAQNSLEQATNGVATAQQSQTDAATALARAQVTAAQGVEDAQRSLAQALSSYALAQQQANTQAALGTQGQQQFAAAMSNLGPAGQNFVNFLIQQVIPAFNSFKSAAEAALLPSLTTFLSQMLPVFTAVEPLILSAGKGIGQFLVNLSSFLGSAQGIKDTQALFTAGNAFFQVMGQVTLVWLQAFGQMGTQMAPLVTLLATGIADMGNAFAHWVSDGGFQKFVNWFITNAPTIMDNFNHIVGLLGILAVSLVPLGQALLGILGPFAAWLASVIQSAPWIGSLIAGFVVLLGAVKPLAGVLHAVFSVFKVGEAIVGGIAKALGFLGRAVVFLAEEAIPALGVAFDFLAANPIVLIIAAIVVGLVALGFGIYELVKHWSAVWDEIKRIGLAAWHFLYNNLVHPIINGFKEAIDFIKDHWQGLLEILLAPFAPVIAIVLAFHDQIIGFFKDLPERVAALWSGLWDGIKRIASDVWHWLYDNVVHPMIDFFTTTIPHAWDSFVSFLTGIPGRVGSALAGLWHIITGAFGDVVGWVTNNVIDPVVNVFSGIPHAVGQALTFIGKVIWDAFRDAVNPLIRIYDDTIGNLGSLVGIPKIPQLPNNPPGLARGGSLHAGEPAFVGEEGVELFVPGVSGSVVSNNQLLAALRDMAGGGGGGASGPVVHFKQYNHTNANPDRLARLAGNQLRLALR